MKVIIGETDPGPLKRRVLYETHGDMAAKGLQAHVGFAPCSFVRNITRMVVEAGGPVKGDWENGTVSGECVFGLAVIWNI